MSSPRKHTSKVRQKLETSGDRVRRARLPKRMRIAFKIADAIEALDWDRKDLAEKLGKYQSQITNWLKGDHNFTIDTLSDIEEILGIKLLALDADDSSNNNEQTAKQPFAQKVEFNVLLGSKKIHSIEVEDECSTSFQGVSNGNNVISISTSLSQALTGYSVTRQ